MRVLRISSSKVHMGPDFLKWEVLIGLFFIIIIIIALHYIHSFDALQTYNH